MNLNNYETIKLIVLTSTDQEKFLQLSADESVNPNAVSILP